MRLPAQPEGLATRYQKLSKKEAPGMPGRLRAAMTVRLTASAKATACLAEALRAKAEAGHYAITAGAGH